MPNINLLPEDLVLTGPLQKGLSLVKNLAFIGIVTFLLLTIGIITFYVFNLFELKTLVSQEEVTKNQIKSLEATEQTIVLVRDRAKIAKLVLDRPGASDPLTKLSTLQSSFPPEVRISAAEVSEGSTKFSVIVQNSSSLVTFMNDLISRNFYKYIELESLNFNQEAGYLVTLTAFD